jgi:hypothetical protein
LEATATALRSAIVDAITQSASGLAVNGTLPTDAYAALVGTLGLAMSSPRQISSSSFQAATSFLGSYARWAAGAGTPGS